MIHLKRFGIGLLVMLVPLGLGSLVVTYPLSRLFILGAGLAALIYFVGWALLD